jgi:broad specificity phosphatase PhoE
MSMTVDLNTIVSGLVLAAIIYVARSVRAIETAQAVSAEKEKAQDRTLDEDRARIIDVETKTSRLEVDVTRLKARRVSAAE